jgi:hypothetical protein
MRRAEIDLAESRHVAEHALPAREPALAIERLVVEADRQERRELADPAATVGRHATERIDRGPVAAAREFRDIGAHVDARAVLHHRVHVVIRKRQHAALTVILEAAPEHRYVGSPQRARNGVAGETLVAPAFV